MDMYIGVSGITRRIKAIYIGVNGVARKVVKGYIGVNGTARLFFTSGYTYTTSIQNNNANNVTFSDYFVGINSSGNIEISATGKGTASTNTNGRAIYFMITGDDIAGKTLTFDYTSSGYSTIYCTINHDEIDTSGNWTSIYELSSSGSKSRTISSNVKSISFGMWFGGQTSTHTGKLIISNLKIGGETITF